MWDLHMIKWGLRDIKYPVLHGTANPNHEILCKYYSGTIW